jgi:hypothetical protein
MDKPLDHIHISEREADGTWEDCTWDSGLEWYRLVYDKSRPATHAEAQLLRHASGEPATGGSNLGNLKTGILRRYGKTTPALISGFSNLQAALTNNKCAVIQGSMKAFGSTHRLSTWDRNFDGSHAVMLMNFGGRLLWCDPEAPTSANVPVAVTWAEVKAFVTAFAGQHLVGPIKNTTIITAPEGGTMPNLNTVLLGYTANLKPLSNVRVLPDIQSTKVRTSGSTKEPIALVGTVTGDVDPGNGSNVWYEFIDKGVHVYTAKDNVLDIKPPVTVVTPDDGYTKATQDAAVAAQKAADQLVIDQQAQVIADQKAEVVAAEAFKAAHKAFIG